MTLLSSAVSLAVTTSLILAGSATAQTPPADQSRSTQDVLKALDQVVEQNKKLEEQNRELMEQVNALRQRLAPSSGGVQSNGVPPPVPEPAAAPAFGGASGAPSETQDDKSLLPQADNGQPGVFGEFNPGRGFTVAEGPLGELNFSGYMAARYLNQLPPDQTARDHLGRPLPVDPRNDFQLHRVMLFTQGWLFSPKFRYSTFLWTVQDTNQVAVGGALTYSFNKYFLVGAGWNAYPGTQSLQGSHPYWESYDRVMADEYFRPFFSQGVFGQGIIVNAWSTGGWSATTTATSTPPRVKSTGLSLKALR